MGASHALISTLQFIFYYDFWFWFLLFVETIDIIMPDNIHGTGDPKEVTVILTFEVGGICCSMEVGPGGFD